MIVVDTTVWIDFLEGKGTIFHRHLARLIEGDAPLALTDIVYGEVLQGIRDDPEYERTREMLRVFPILRLQGLDTFDHAATIYRAARKRGLTIRRTLDCLIAATCLAVGAEIFHNDRDFDAIARVSGLRTYRSG